jgi:deoxyribose-phosphate aldolase
MYPEIETRIGNKFINPINIIPLIDLTSLNADDDETTITALCKNAQTPYGNVASVCVYPKFVNLVVNLLKNTPIKIDTVVNFPTGDFTMAETLSLTEAAISNGANEIDMVFPYKTYCRGDKNTAIECVSNVKKLCRNNVKLKVIIETGELKSSELIQIISTDAINAGADFIKTSTGKTMQSATIEAAEIILNTIHAHTITDNRTVGLKVSGGIRTIDQALSYIEVAQKIMGTNWIQPDFFRIGASSLLNEITYAAKHANK